MIRLAALATLIAAPAIADTWEIQRETAAISFFTYHNHGSQNSRHGTFPVQDDHLSGAVHVVVSSDCEDVTPLPPPGWISLPATKCIPDGESFTFELQPGLM